MLPRFVKPWKELGGTTVRGVLDRRIVENASALYASYFTTLLLPLVTVPYLARVLGPETWGAVILIQAIGMYVHLIVMYAFETSATREVARHQSDTARIALVASGVLGARLLLAFTCVAFVAAAQLAVPAFRAESLMLWLGVFWFASIGFRPLWYFLGIERVGKYLAIEMASKTLAVIGIFVVVRGPEDAWLVFALQGAGAAVATLIGTALLYRSIPYRTPMVRQSIAWLKQGWHLFIFHVSTSIYNMSNTIILGFVSVPASVSFYGGAERISRALISMIYPLVQAIFPRSSSLMVEDRHAAARLARLTIVMISLAGALGYLALYFLAPFIVRILLGDGYAEAATVLRVLLLVLPVMGISAPLITHWLVPLGLESLATKVTITAGVMHVPLAVLLGWHFAHVGIAWALVITELYITSVLIVFSLLRGLGPFRLISMDERIESAATNYGVGTNAVRYSHRDS